MHRMNANKFHLRKSKLRRTRDAFTFVDKQYPSFVDTT